MKEHYLLNPDVIFLNHGSFGATPRPVLKAYQNWQTRLERLPVQLLGRELWDKLKKARQILGDYLNADAVIWFTSLMPPLGPTSSLVH